MKLWFAFVKNMQKKDNSTLKEKLGLRKAALKKINACGIQPKILETHGGKGEIFKKIYGRYDGGIVFETDIKKAKVLAKQRGSWRVYNSKCEKSIKDGVCDGVNLNFFDIDPYGSPWEVIDTILNSKIKLQKKIVFCVNDGLRKKIQLGGGWVVGCLKEEVNKYGNAEMHKNYLKICKEMMIKKAGDVGLNVTSWNGYYCGHAQSMTHYAAILER